MNGVPPITGGGVFSTALDCYLQQKLQAHTGFHEIVFNRASIARPTAFASPRSIPLCMAIVREDSLSFYLRTPDEYHKLATDNVRAAEASGIPSDEAAAVGQTWLRLAEESEKQAG